MGVGTKIYFLTKSHAFDYYVFAFQKSPYQQASKANGDRIVKRAKKCSYYNGGYCASTRVSANVRTLYKLKDNLGVKDVDASISIKLFQGIYRGQNTNVQVVRILGKMGNK